MFEKAKWIESSNRSNECAHIFRKNFQLQEKLSTEIAICGLGFYVLKINGNRVSQELLTPPFTAYDKRVLYQVYDITEYVTIGDNLIEVTCGNGWYNQLEADVWQFHHATWKAAPKMICQVNVDGKCHLVSDNSWETTKSKTIFNSLRLGETYNAALEAQEYIPARIARGPGGVLEKQTMPAVKLQGTYEGKEIFPSIYDFGQSITGNVEIKVQGCAGDKISLIYSERIHDDGSLDRQEIKKHVLSERFAQDEYLLCGEGEEIWHGEFSFHGFRYVQLHHSDTVKIISLTARDIHTDLSLIGDYSCDNSDINQLHQACIRAFLTNYLHFPMDCPHREKNGWTADAMLSSFHALYNLDMKESFMKWLDDIVDCQRANGAIPCIAPTSIWGYGWGSGVTWDAALFVIPWNLYWFTGDLAIIERYYPAMERYLGFLETQALNDIFTIGLGDWNAPNKESQCDERALLTCYAKHVFDLFSKMSKLLGLTDKEAYATKRSLEIRSAFCKEFLGKHHPCQTYYAILIYFDMVENKEEVAELLAEMIRKNDGYIDAGIFGAYFIPTVLRNYGYFELAWEMVCKKDYPGWIYMMNCCHGALGKWDGSSSLDHHMFSSIDGFIQESLSGIQMHTAEVGFKHIHLKPYFPKDLAHFAFWHKVDEGNIEINWNNEIYRVTLPEGISGVVELNGKIFDLQSGKNILKRD